VDELENLAWLEPWQPILSPSNLEIELEQEIREGHMLFGRKAIAVGRRIDCDEVLVHLSERVCPLAVVYLDAKRKRDERSQYPCTALYASLEDWVERCMKPDHEEWK